MGKDILQSVRDELHIQRRLLVPHVVILMVVSFALGVIF